MPSSSFLVLLYTYSFFLSYFFPACFFFASSNRFLLFTSSSSSTPSIVLFFAFQVRRTPTIFNSLLNLLVDSFRLTDGFFSAATTSSFSYSLGCVRSLHLVCIAYIYCSDGAVYFSCFYINIFDCRPHKRHVSLIYFVLFFTLGCLFLFACFPFFCWQILIRRLVTWKSWNWIFFFFFSLEVCWREKL